MVKEFKIGVIIHLLMQLMKNGAGRIGKTAMQKYVYFLQEFGVNLNYRYEMYYYGPYCFELSNDLDLLNMLGVIAIKDSPTTYGYSIELLDNTDKYMKQTEAQNTLETCQSGFDKLLSIFDNCSTRELELYATMHFVDSILKKKSKIADAESVIFEVKFLKPKYSTDECEAAYQYLAENFGWR